MNAAIVTVATKLGSTAEAARLAADAHRTLVASLLSLEAAGVTFAPAAEVELAALIEDSDAFASEMLRVAGGVRAEPSAIEDHPARDLPKIPYSDPAYVEMWDRVAADWRDRNSFRHLRNYGRSRSTVEAFETQTVFIGKPATDRVRAASQRVPAPALSLAWSADYGQA